MAYHPATSQLSQHIPWGPMTQAEAPYLQIRPAVVRRAPKGPEGPVEEHVGEISMARFTGWWLSLPL